MPSVRCPHCGEVFEGTWSKAVDIDRERLRELRQEKGLFQRELGHAIGYSENAITQWELGNSRPNLKCVEGMAAVLECDVEELLAE